MGSTGSGSPEAGDLVKCWCRSSERLRMGAAARHCTGGAARSRELLCSVFTLVSTSLVTFGSVFSFESFMVVFALGRSQLVSLVVVL